MDLPFPPTTLRRHSHGQEKGVKEKHHILYEFLQAVSHDCVMIAVTQTVREILENLNSGKSIQVYIQFKLLL